MFQPMARKVAAAGAAALIAAGIIGGGVYAEQQHSSASAVVAAASITSASTSTATTTAAGKAAKASPLKGVLDNLVANNTITSAQESAIISAFQQYRQEHQGAARAQLAAYRRAMLAAVAQSLNLQPKQLRQDLKQGQSIAQIAQSQNVPLQTVSDAAYAAAQKQASQAVSAGILTQDRADRILSQLKQRLPQLLNASHQGKAKQTTTTTSTTVAP